MGEGIEWVNTKRTLCFPGGLKLLGAVLGSVGDLCRATPGEGETEPKQIGDGTQDSTERRDGPGT